ncbi:MAG: hypothetical protein LUH47_06285 [Clostridiales bacterium]|nr:hypothetical protein [Clostridiales bacterium]
MEQGNKKDILTIEKSKNTVKRNIKDTVFTKMFSEKKYLLKLYQALHPEDTTSTEDDLKTITLETVFLKDITNDLGFSVNDRIFILVEAQSTVSVNIIIRSFMYLAHTYQQYFKETRQNLYGTKPVKIPKPELYVIFTRNTRDDRDVIKLSEEFFGGQQTAIEVKVNVITDKNSKGIVEQYIIFTKVLDEQVKKFGSARKAVEETIRICKDKDILREFLEEHEKEVVDIMISLYNQEEIYDMFLYDIKKESRAEGEAKGEVKGKECVALEMLKNDYDFSVISKLTKISLERIKELKSLLTNNLQPTSE